MFRFAHDHSRDQLLQNLTAVVEEGDKVLVELSCIFILEKFASVQVVNLTWKKKARISEGFAGRSFASDARDGMHVANTPVLEYYSRSS
ncbi:hypothetical protein KI387_033714, partial [Taxus chinensis]